MDKASIIKDAIEYILQLQQLERQLLAEISLLESAGVDSCCDGHAVVSPTKKMKTDLLPPGSTASHGSSAPSQPVDALEVIIANCNPFTILIFLSVIRFIKKCKNQYNNLHKRRISILGCFCPAWTDDGISETRTGEGFGRAG
jgi:hypothetical protein